jgi:Zn-dependent peptidase ImmA (M78 family)
VTGSPYTLLAAYADVQLIWTAKASTLRGARARWFPDHRVIAIDSRLRRLISRCSLAHELGHVVLEHPTPCGNEFFDRRVEEEADEFAARLLLDDLDELACELATTCGHGHAAANLRVTLDMLDTRLRTLTELERAHLSRVVWNVHESVGA